MSSQKILSLLQERDGLLQQLNEINAQIIRATLEPGQSASNFATAKSGKPAKGAKRRKWFERGEMIALSRKLLTKPMSQADLVRGLLGAKGYEKSLSAPEKARCKSAAYQAIAAALSAKQMVRNKSGQVALARR